MPIPHGVDDAHPQPPRPPKEACPCATRVRLLEAALECFAESGFEATSLRMIALKAGRPLSLLAHHFGNKEGLYVETFRFMFQSHRAGKAWYESMPPEGFAPRDAQEAASFFRQQIRAILDDTLSDPECQDPRREFGLKLWLREIRAPRPSLHAAIQQVLGPTSSTMLNCLHMLRPDLDDDQANLLGMTILNGVAGHGIMDGLNRLVWKTDWNPDKRSQAADLLVEFIIRGLGSPRSGP
jgi:AcrR family transcriptional regulator